MPPTANILAKPIRRAVRVLDYGSIIEIRPLNTAGKKWVDDNVIADPWQWMGRDLVVEHRYIEPIIAAMSQDGLDIEFA
jgi:hypothetical protein